MSEIKIQENVVVTYKNDKITIKGETFVMEGILAGSELMQVYWGNTGKGSVKLTLNVPDKPTKADEPVVAKQESKKVQDKVVSKEPNKTAQTKKPRTPTRSSKSVRNKRFGPDWFDQY